VTESNYASWGGYPNFEQPGRALSWRSEDLPARAEAETLLPFGNGRSYGDVCLNRGGTVLDTRALNRFIDFDSETGMLRCEAGVLLADVLAMAVPLGWFLPVSPGTRYATLGGALANDVHGKNHHRAGTFGCHVRSFELLRSDGSRLTCTAEENSELFAATMGGLGLTGLVTWIELQLRRVSGPMLMEESIKFANLDEFFQLSDASEKDYEYTVAWVDCVSSGEGLGRGIFERANHTDGVYEGKPVSLEPRVHVPFKPPVSLVNSWSLKAFNSLYYARHPAGERLRRLHFQSFFYPLDSIGNWNRIYGPKGMLQYQCVLPGDDGREVMRDMLRAISNSGNGSFLAVLKVFGDRQSPGLMSFPRPGVTLALDFPTNPSVFRLLDRLDDMTREVKGAVYPAKDARMTAESFRCYFPGWERFSEFVDPGFSSSFWRRVGGEQL